MWYARHGHELMEWKSPVGVPVESTIWTNITTRRRPGQTREGMSEGSPSANVRAVGQKPHKRRGSQANQHNVTQPHRCTGQGRCGGCARKVHARIRGDLFARRPNGVTGVGLRPGAKAPGSPPESDTTLAARQRETVGVFEQKSTDSIVAKRPSQWVGRGEGRNLRQRESRASRFRSPRIIFQLVNRDLPGLVPHGIGRANARPILICWAVALNRTVVGSN